MIERYNLTGTPDERSRQLLLLVMSTRDSPYVIELYSVLLECLRFNMHRILHPDAGPGDIGRYQNLVKEIERRELLPGRLIRLLCGFYRHRNDVIHNAIFNRNFTDAKLDEWFDAGVFLNTLLLSEIDKSKPDFDQYNVIALTPDFNV